MLYIPTRTRGFGESWDVFIRDHIFGFIIVQIFGQPPEA